MFDKIFDKKKNVQKRRINYFLPFLIKKCKIIILLVYEFHS